MPRTARRQFRRPALRHGGDPQRFVYAQRFSAVAAAARSCIKRAVARSSVRDDQDELAGCALTRRELGAADAERDSGIAFQRREADLLARACARTRRPAGGPARAGSRVARRGGANRREPRDLFLGEEGAANTGHIPGATCLPCQELVDGATGLWAAPAAVARLARDAGIDPERPPQELIATCRSGVCATVAMLALEQIGVHCEGSTTDLSTNGVPTGRDRSPTGGRHSETIWRGPAATTDCPRDRRAPGPHVGTAPVPQ
jgi:hypothetical protein